MFFLFVISFDVPLQLIECFSPPAVPNLLLYSSTGVSILIFRIFSTNIFILFYFKYAMNFFFQFSVEILNHVTIPLNITNIAGLPSGKESACQFWRYKRCSFNPWVGKIPWRRKQQPTPAFLPGESHGQSTLVGYGP